MNVASTRALSTSIDHQFGALIERRRSTLGLFVSLAGLVLVTAVMLPVRSDLPASTAALVLLVPVVAGVMLGGLRVAVAGVVIGTLEYAYFFKSPYRSFGLSGSDWVDAGAYVVVALLVAGVVGHARRLQSEASRAEILGQMDRLKSALLRAVSHDLRTPLASITASVSDLLDSSVMLDESDQRFLLTTIESEAIRLTRLVSNLLDMSRVECGAVVVQRRPIQLSELVDDVADRMKDRLGGTAVHVGIAPSDIVEGDYALTAQALVNLLENAARHGSSPTGVALHTRHLGATIELDVIDRGAGIAAGGRSHLFEPFYRGETQGASGGTGLGLAICSAFLEAQGGAVRLSDTPGGGATFTLILPSLQGSADNVVAGV